MPTVAIRRTQVVNGTLYSGGAIYDVDYELARKLDLNTMVRALGDKAPICVMFDVLATANVIDALTRSAQKVCDELKIVALIVSPTGRRELVAAVNTGRPLSSVEYSISLNCGKLDARTAMMRLHEWMQTFVRVDEGEVEFLIQPASVPATRFEVPVLFGSAHYPMGEISGD